MNKTSRFATNLITVHSLDDVPDFATEAEEADFWGTHTLSDELLEQASHIEDPLLPPRVPRSDSRSAFRLRLRSGCGPSQRRSAWTTSR
ncbi:MAG: BrnA antitoxin family protein [Dehalococcoidia bacterium]|nr:BrnA antitoxin family protein [Dehalococcoidia bacterium]